MTADQKSQSGKPDPAREAKAERPIFDPRIADAQYNSFPPFGDWARTSVDRRRWTRYSDQLRKILASSSPELRERASEIVRLAAAIDTGAIEGLYEVDRGFTFSVAMQAALWQTAVLEAKGERARALIESQMEGYQRVLDLATGATPIAEAWIRELHRQLCASQGSYRALTELGYQDLELPLGQYKALANHARGRDGGVHSYAPVDLTPTEVYRLVETLRSLEFTEAHPVLQASYSHYAIVAIHPFADGNGRVARALASVYTYRSDRVPLLVLADTKAEYFDALAAADAGNYDPFVTFVESRGIDAMQMALESHAAAAAPDPEEIAAGLRRLYVTTGGYTQQQVDEAGYTLLGAISEELEQQAAHLRSPQLQISVSVSNTNEEIAPRADYRIPSTHGLQMVYLTVASARPRSERMFSKIWVEVPNDAATDAGILLLDSTTTETSEARMSELLPVPGISLRFRLQIVARRMLGDNLGSLAASVRALSIDSAAGAASLKRIEIKQAVVQHDLAIMLERVELTEKETRLYVAVTNQSTAKASVFTHQARIVQSSRQLEPINHPRFPSELLAGINAETVIVFDPVKLTEPFRLVWDGPHLQGPSLRFRPYEWSVNPD